MRGPRLLPPLFTDPLPLVPRGFSADLGVSAGLAVHGLLWAAVREALMTGVVMAAAASAAPMPGAFSGTELR